MSSTNPLVIFHFPTSKTNDGLNDKMNTLDLKVRLPANVFNIKKMTQTTTGIQYWTPSRQKKFLWGGFQYSIESISLTNQITVAFNRNDDLPTSLEGSTNRHSNNTIEPLIPQATLILRCRKLREIDNAEKEPKADSTSYLNIHIPVVSSTHPQLGTSGIRTIDYSPGFDNNLFEQMNPPPGNTILQSFDLDLTFLQYRKGVYPNMFIIKMSDTDTNAYMNRVLRISGSSSLYPIITSSQFSASTSQYLSRILQKPDKNPAATINIMKNGTFHKEPIYYSTFSEFQSQLYTGTGIPAQLRDKNNKIVSNSVINRILSENEKSYDTSKNTIKDMFLMGLYIILTVIILFIAYNGFPYLWSSLKGYNSYLLYGLYIGIFLIFLVILFLLYRLYKFFYGKDNQFYENFMMFLYLLFVGTHYYQPFSNGFSNILLPTGLPKIDRFKENIETIYNDMKILPLPQETEFKQQIIDTLFNGQSSKVSIYKSMTSENWELFKKHLAFDDDGTLKAYVLKDLPEGQTLEQFFQQNNINDNIKPFKIETGEGEVEVEVEELKVETNLGIILLNVSILLIELYLLIEMIIQIYFSVGKLGGKDEQENTNQVWNIIINTFFMICIFILWIIQFYRLQNS
jgi:hypothetical protein